MSRPFSPRLPFYPLLRASGATSKGQFAGMVGKHRREVYRWGQEGLTPEAAESLCERLRINPFEVWPDWSTYWEAA